MNWDNKAYEHAEARSWEYFGHLPEQMFEHGAKWQRNQLRTNGAIERVERVLLDELEGIPISDREFTRIAHTAITALLGQEPRP